MGEVWLGHSKLAGGLSRSVAIKRIISKHAQDDQMRQQFLVEAQASLGLRHANIVFVFDYLQIEGQDCLVMEWVQGVNAAELLTHLRNHGPWPLPQDIAVYIAICILRALDYTHNLNTDPLLGSGLIHRDVSPQNILVSVQGEVKLSDFGVARLSDAATTIGGPKGKIAYMAPEQFHRKHDKRVDLYSVGAVLYEMLTGHRYQYLGEETSEPDEDAPILEAFATTELSCELARVVAQLLRQRPAQRTAHAHQALAQLHSLLDIGEQRVKSQLGSLVTAAYRTVQAHQRKHPQKAEHSVPVDVASSLIAHQILDETARPAPPPSTPLQDQLAPSTLQETSETKLSSEPAKPQRIQAWLPAIGIFLSATFGLGLVWKSGFFSMERSSKLATPSKAAAEDLKSNAPKPAPAFALTLEQAKTNSIKQIDALLQKSPTPQSDDWHALESLLAFNLRLMPNGKKPIDTAWISACAKDTKKSQSCQAAFKLIPAHQRSKAPATTQITPALSSTTRQPLLDRTLKLLLETQQEQVRATLESLLANALENPQSHALKAEVFRANTVNALRAPKTSVPGQFTRSGWNAGVKRALCDAVRSHKTPEWQSLHSSFSGDQNPTQAPLLQLFQQQRNQAWSSFLEKVQPIRPLKLTSIKKLLGHPQSPEQSLAHRVLSVLESEGTLVLNNCSKTTSNQPTQRALTTHFAQALGRSFQSPSQSISQSQIAQRYLKAQSKTLEIVEAIQRGPGPNQAGQKQLRAILASVPQIQTSDFKGAKNLNQILRFPSEAAKDWAASQETEELDQAWCTSVYRPFLANLGKRYPFASQAKREVDLRALKQFIHPKQGSLWTFVRQHKAKIAQHQGSFIATPEAKKQGLALSRSALDFLNQAWLLARAIYPDQARQARVSLMVELPPGGSFSRAQWVSKANTIDVRPGQAAQKELVWPRDFDSHPTQLAFFSQKAPNSPAFVIRSKPGIWSLFRILSQGYVLSDRGRQFTLLWSSPQGNAQEKLRFRVLHEPSPFFGERGHRTRFLRSFALAPPTRPIPGRPSCK